MAGPICLKAPGAREPLPLDMLNIDGNCVDCGSRIKQEDGLLWYYFGRCGDCVAVMSEEERAHWSSILPERKEHHG